MKKKLALVLSGGGFKGAFQVGALDYILENPILLGGERKSVAHFDLVSGVSVGSLNGAMVATHQFEYLRELWFERIANEGPGIIYESKFLKNGQPDPESIMKEFLPKLGVFKQLGVVFSKKKREQLVQEVIEKLLKLRSLADHSPLLDTLNETLTLDMFKDTIYRMGHVSLNDGAYYSQSVEDFNDIREFNKAILASSTMPIVWAPVDQIEDKFGQRIYNSVDGGIRNVSPLKDVIREINADSEEAEYFIVVINCQPKELSVKDTEYNIISIATRSLIDITLAEIFRNDVDQFLFINKLLKAQGLSSVEVEGKTYKAFNIKVIQPKESLGNSLDASKATLERRRRIGYEIAKSVFEGGTAPDWNV